VDKDSKRERESPRKREHEGNRQKDMDICREHKDIEEPYP
jgi:hypothetical protein